jgi:AraC-like DNA-binding protein
MSTYTINDMPDQYLPELSDLTGDLRMLAELVGVRMALQISALFDGTPARLYGHRRWLIRWRDQLIRAEYDKGGISIIDLARKVGLSDRHVLTILGKVPGEERQMKLF